MLGTDVILALVMLGIILAGAITLTAVALCSIKRDRRRAEALDEENKGLSSLVRSLEVSRDNLESEREELISEREGLSGELSSVRAERDALKDKSGAPVSKKQSSREIQTLKKRLAQAEARNEALVSEKEKILARAQALTKESTALTRENTALTKRVEALGRENTALASQRDALDKASTALEGEKRALVAKEADAARRADELQSRLDGQEMYIERITASNESFREALAKAREILVYATDATSVQYLRDEVQRAIDALNAAFD
ncbi:MAG: hypothetical protein J6L90_05150 [Clostridia bacterium]|nr:hypothetical protein [Clostridia bacterium]